MHIYLWPIKLSLILENRFVRIEDGSGSCHMVGFGISVVEPPGSY